MAQEHDPGAWAGLLATQILERAAAQQREREREQQQTAAFRTLVQTNGPVFVQRVAAELDGIARAFNARVGYAALTCHQSPSGALSLICLRHRWSVLVMPDVDTAVANMWGLMVTMQDGRWSQTPYRFVAEGEQLRVWVDGLALGPEAAVRQLLERWLQGLPLGGR